jgi:hypothetical protein
MTQKLYFIWIFWEIDEMTSSKDFFKNELWIDSPSLLYQDTNLNRILIPFPELIYKIFGHPSILFRIRDSVIQKVGRLEAFHFRSPNSNPRLLAVWIKIDESLIDYLIGNNRINIFINLAERNRQRVKNTGIEEKKLALDILSIWLSQQVEIKLLEIGKSSKFNVAIQLTGGAEKGKEFEILTRPPEKVKEFNFLLFPISGKLQFVNTQLKGLLLPKDFGINSLVDYLQRSGDRKYFPLVSDSHISFETTIVEDSPGKNQKSYQTLWAKHGGNNESWLFTGSKWKNLPSKAWTPIYTIESGSQGHKYNNILVLGRILYSKNDNTNKDEITILQGSFTGRIGLKLEQN